MTPFAKSPIPTLVRFLLGLLAVLALIYCAIVRPPVGRPDPQSKPRIEAEAYLRSLPATHLSVNDRNEIVSIAAGKAIDDSGTAYLAHFPKLRELYLVESDVSRVGVERIGRIPTLERLTLVGGNIDDSCVDVLADKMHNLRDIEIGTQGVTNASVASFSRMPQLKVLSLVSTRITPAGLEELRSHLPHTSIEVQGGTSGN